MGWCEMMVNQFSFRVLLVFALLAFLSACGGKDPVLPQAIDEEIDVCEVCYMMVPDNGFGAQIVDSNGKAYKFDDIGCMAMYINDYQPEGQAYTRDYYTNEWFEIEKSLFVLTEDVETPMNYGYVSFGSRTNLDKFLTESNGAEMTWGDVLDTMKERSNNE